MHTLEDTGHQVAQPGHGGCVVRAGGIERQRETDGGSKLHNVGNPPSFPGGQGAREMARSMGQHLTARDMYAPTPWPCQWAPSPRRL